MPISDIVKRRLGTNPRRRFLLWHQSGHFTAKPPAKKQVFVQYPIGGGEGSRTPVRKPVHMVFSERSRWLEFPGTVAHRQTAMSGSFFGHDLFKSKREVHVHRFLTFHTRPWSSGGNGWHTATAQPLGCQCYFLIVSVYFLLGLFESLPGLCSLTILQDPRRNLYAPISLYFDI